jgi:hypothetical protein
MKPSRPEILPPTKPLPKQRRRGGRLFLIVLGCVLGLVFVWLERDRLFNVGAPAGIQAKVYYLSPAGSDSNSGQSASVPWLTPHHPLNCGDVVVAASSTDYSAVNFGTGKWGTVTCSSADNVAWLKCATFDSCKIRGTTAPGMWVDQSFWGIQGWEVTTSSTDSYGGCFVAQPNYDAPTEIHHIIFANDIANGCAQGGFNVANHGSAGVDYLAILGSIAYNAAQGNTSCASGISIFQPVQSDVLAGTHIYVAGNFSYSNLDPVQCNGAPPTDGAGIIFDSFDGSQGNISPYSAQAVAYNNIVINNGGKGLEVNNNSAGSYHSAIWFSQNTSWGNLTDPNQTWLGCAEVSVYKAGNVHIYANLISTKAPTGCSGHTIYALAISGGDATNSVVNNLAYGYGGNNTFLYDSGSFAWGSGNQFGISPGFRNPIVPGPPACGGTPDVPRCVASLIADFVTTTASAVNLGYHQPTSIPDHDVLFPQWLCTAHIPSGLVTMGCD